jgi:FixJ family two-component response regulator
LQDKSIVSIVDDDESVRVATMKLLRLHGFVVHAFASAEEFLRSPQLNDTRCLIADVRMPGMTGPALQEHLLRHGHRIPTIFITAFPEDRSRARAMSAGAVAFLSKPFSGQILIDHISKVLKGAREGTAGA